jgi:hypothetical protein
LLYFLSNSYYFKLRRLCLMRIRVFGLAVAAVFLANGVSVSFFGTQPMTLPT